MRLAASFTPSHLRQPFELRRVLGPELARVRLNAQPDRHGRSHLNTPSASWSMRMNLLSRSKPGTPCTKLIILSSATVIEPKRLVVKLTSGIVFSAVFIFS
jgi:hypothetical protein